ncbi:uncharacterized protein LOC142175126 [Nicotiana tabacum]|uniref:Uncharacterized protein LOC142175126 n=1 Tax=Nicotiana tabacum TaxID=4097 RepID=A0AC58TKQ3_TOBAC
MSGQIQGSLPSNTEKNPKEHLKAISLRSGKSLDDPYADREGKPQEVEKVNEGENKIESKFPKEQKDKRKNVLKNELITNPHSVPLLFPQKMKREKLDKQFSKFLDILKQLYINIPFTDALTQMPSYVKFLKEILSSKRKLEEVSAVKLTEKCSAILQNKLPQKLGDPGSFTIPCTVGELGEMKDTGVSLQLADQSTKRPKGIIENILVRVDKFFSQSRTISDDNPIIGEEAEILEKESENEKVSQEEVQSKMELKNLPSYLKYVFLEPELFPGTISSSLIPEQEYKLIEVLRKHKRALGWTIADIKGINPAICMHRIHMEENCKPIVQPQRRLNLAMQEVVKKEVIPIAPEDQEKITFTCPQGTYAYRRMPFGLCNAPATFQHYMSAIFSDMTEKFLEIIMDDFTLFGLSPPTTVKGIISFLGHADNCRKAFEILKKQLTNAPIVVSPDWSQPFEIMCDASDIAVGAILGQKRDKIFRPIYYASRTLNEAQKNYATIEKELLAVVFMLLKYLLAKKDARPRLLRWILLLQEFDLKIKDRKGSENQVADHISRLENPPTEIKDIKEEFPDEHIFLVTTIINLSPWRCVPETEMNNISSHCHDGAAGGNYGGRKTTTKVLEVGFFWPTLFKDGRNYVATCDKC